MKTLTVAESAKWCTTRGIELDTRGMPRHPGKDLHYLRFEVPTSVHRLAWFCRFIEAKLQPRNQCLLWVTSWGVWESSENWHLYYRLRQSYKDSRLLEEAPGHLFLEFETHDLVSFLQVGLTAGWDMHLLPSGGYSRAFMSHDGWVEFALVDATELEKIRVELAL
jgi:hypothetical protein